MTSLMESLSTYMVPFNMFFPEINLLQSGNFFKVMRGEEELGIFMALELYCPDPDCDCQKVLIQFFEVINQEPRAHASLSYGWESIPFYQKWGGMTKKEALEMKEGYLEPFNPQLQYAPELLEAFRSRIKEDPQFLKKLKLHYTMVKDKISQKEEHKKNVIPIRPRR